MSGKDHLIYRIYVLKIISYLWKCFEFDSRGVTRINFVFDQYQGPTGRIGLGRMQNTNLDKARHSPHPQVTGIDEGLGNHHVYKDWSLIGLLGAP